MFRLVGFDCKGQVIPSASLLPSTTDYESIQKQPHNQVRRSPAPAPNNQALSLCPVTVTPSVPKAQDTRTGRWSHQSQGRERTQWGARLARQRSSFLLWSPKALGTALLALACLAHTWRLSDKETHPVDPFVPSKVSQAYISALDNQLAWQSRYRLKENF